MGVHLRSIVEECRYGSCSSRATQELYNAVNARSGKFCTKHSKLALRDFIAKHGENHA